MKATKIAMSEQNCIWRWG